MTLKPLYQQIGRKIDELSRLAPSDQVTLAIERLEQCRADFARICGPTMDFPPGSQPIA